MIVSSNSKELDARPTTELDSLDASGLPRVLIVAPSIRIMGGQAVMAKQLINEFHGSGLPAGFLPINPKPPGILQYAERVKFLRTLVVSFFYVISLIRRVPRYDVIHIFSASYFSFIISQTPAILISRCFGKRIVLNYRSGQCDDHLQKWKLIVYPILRLIDRIIVPSQFLVDVFAKHGFEASAIANVVDVQDFPFVDREHFKPKILVPRMLDPIYNVECSIRAFHIVKQQVPDAELTVLGDGPQEGYLKKLVEELELEGVTFVGRVDRSRIPSLYQEHDVFLNSSSIDNMPVSILEAYAVGLPVVSTDAGGIPYIVKDEETGYLAPVNDHQGLASRLLKVIQSPEKTRQIVHAAKLESNRYRWPAVAKQWFDLYRTLAPRSNSPEKVVD